MDCPQCDMGEENMCKQKVVTYQSKDKGSGRAETYPKGGVTAGGYTSRMVVHERFAIKIPDAYPLECAGPIMCAGITMYDPLKKHGVGSGSRVGIIGLGGLGQVGVKLAKALGCIVTVISRSDAKRDFAMQTCGAQTFLASSNKAEMKAQAQTLDLILNTIPNYHDATVYSKLLRGSGRQVLLGQNKQTAGAMFVNKFVCGRSRIVMSLVGGIKNTQEVIDLCAEHKIYPEIAVVPVWDLNQVYEKLDDNSTGVRYVLDIEGTLTDEATVNAKCTAPPPQLAPFNGDFSVPGAVGQCCWMFWCCKWC